MINRIFSVFFLSLLVASISIHIVKAQSEFDPDFYSGNDILFYDPDASCGVPSKSGSPTLIGNSNAEKIWNFLVGKGLTNEQTAGVMGNIQAESNYEPGAVESNSVGFGIAQWSYGRRTALEAAAKKKGVAVSDMAFQLEYLYQELTARETNRPEYRQFSNEWDMIKGQKTIEDALVAFHHEFEISHLMNEPDPRAAVIRERLKAAKDAFASFSKNTPTASSGKSDCNSAPTGNLEAATLAYAWPNYRGNDVERKPEYAAAVKKTESEGRYVGDCHGVDCGGFVTILVRDSGLDPSYNSSGKGGNTSAQKAWAEKNWQTVGRGGSFNTADLKAGDVALKEGHTYIYVGDVPGFDSKIASASQCERAPMAGKESLVDNEFTWYRKK